MIDQFLEQTSVMQATLTFEEKKHVRAGDVAGVVEHRLTAARTAMQRDKWQGPILDLCWVAGGLSLFWWQMSLLEHGAALLTLLTPQITSLLTKGYEQRVRENVARDEMVLTVWKAIEAEAAKPGDSDSDRHEMPTLPEAGAGVQS